MNKRTIKEGFVKVLNGEKNIITVGNIKLGKKTKWSTQYIIFLQDTIDKSYEIYIFDSQNDAYKNLPKSIFHLDIETDATQMVATLGEQFCVIVSSLKETLTFSCNYYGELLDWISYINRNVKGIARAGSKQGNLPPLPKEADLKKEFKRGCSDPGKRIEETGLETQNRSTSAVRESVCDMENNSIYGRHNIFAVDIVQNETANNLNLEGRYNLLIHNGGIQLLHIDTSEPLHHWPVQVLRRFGSSNSRFSFESGRSSRTGVGQFEFFTPSCKLINEAMTQLTEHVKTGMNTNDIYQRTLKSPVPRQQSPLKNSHHATNVQSSFAKEKFSERLRNTPVETIRGSPIASVDSLNERFSNSENINSSKKSLPFEIESNYDNYLVEDGNKKIRSQTSDQEPNYIKFSTKNSFTKLDQHRTDSPTYINMEPILRVAENQDLSPIDGRTPMNAPLILERMRSESEPLIVNAADSGETVYVNLQNMNLISDFIPPAVRVSKPSNSFETESPGLQKSVHSHSTQDISNLFEESADTKKLTTTLPKSFSTMQLSPQQQQQRQHFFPQQQQQQPQFYYPPSQQYIPPVQRFYHPIPQQVYPHQQLSYLTPSQHSFPYLEPQRQQHYPPPYGQPHHNFIMNTHVYPRSAPSSGAIDPSQRPTPREAYPGSAPTSGYHHRDMYHQ